MNTSNTTIIYYTSNKEDQNFENKIRENILKVKGDIPLISVSQKPIDFGENICVGEVGACDANLFRQIQIGCEAAKTKYVIAAEADCLYPPEYFNFKIEKDFNYCRFDNLYVLYQHYYNGFLKKDTAPFAQIINREYYIKIIKEALNGQSYWNKPKVKIKIPLFLDKNWEKYHLNNPIINLKTKDGMRRKTSTTGKPIEKIPYWGTVEEVRSKLWH